MKKIYYFFDTVTSNFSVLTFCSALTLGIIYQDAFIAVGGLLYASIIGLIEMGSKK